MRGRGRRRGWQQGGASRLAMRFVEPTLLLLLHHRPAHGYPLIEQLSEYGLGGIEPSALYRALREMEDRGWVVSCWEEAGTLGPPRRVYRLTELGHEVLGQWAADLQEMRQMVDRILASYALHMEEGEGDYH